MPNVSKVFFLYKHKGKNLIILTIHFCFIRISKESNENSALFYHQSKQWYENNISFHPILFHLIIFHPAYYNLSNKAQEQWVCNVIVTIMIIYHASIMSILHGMNAFKFQLYGYRNTCLSFIFHWKLAVAYQSDHIAENYKNQAAH